MTRCSPSATALARFLSLTRNSLADTQISSMPQCCHRGPTLLSGGGSKKKLFFFGVAGSGGGGGGVGRMTDQAARVSGRSGRGGGGRVGAGAVRPRRSGRRASS